MKRVLFTFALLMAILLASSIKTQAQTTFKCILTITDTCNGGGYNGSYDVTVDLYYNNGYQCTGTGTTTGGTHCVTLTTSCIPNGTGQLYQEDLTKVKRSVGTCGITPSMMTISYYYWYQLTNCPSSPQFSVTF